jgi:hypothetical protein
MRLAGALLAAALCVACGPVAAISLRVEAPLRIPEECDRLEITGQRGDEVFYNRVFQLTSGTQFPLSLSLETRNREHLTAGPLDLSVTASKGAELSREWSTGTVSVSLAEGEITEAVVRLCNCPG